MEIDYPVWRHLGTNIPIIEQMAELIHLESFSDPVLICTGSSGLFISSIISYQFLTPIEVHYLRKPYEGGHNHGRPSINGKQLIIVDDFINTGDTIRYIMETIRDRYDFLGKFDALCVSHIQDSMREKWKPHFKKILSL